MAMLAFGYAGEVNEFATSVGPRLLMIKSLGYDGEVGAINAWIGFATGMWRWAFIIFKIFEAGNTSSEFSDAVRRLSTTCALSSLLDGPSILLATYVAHSPVLWILSCSM